MKITRFCDLTLSDGILFVTPEYNRAIPGMLKISSTEPLGLQAKTPGQANLRQLLLLDFIKIIFFIYFLFVFYKHLIPGTSQPAL